MNHNYLVLYSIIISFTTALCSQPDSCLYYLSIGDHYYSNFDNSNALRCYQEAYRLCPHQYDPQMKLLRAFIDYGEDQRGKPSNLFFLKALSFADTLIRQYPDSAQAYFLKAAAAVNLILLLKGKQKIMLAQTIEINCLKSIALDSTKAPAYIVLGAYYREIASASLLLKILARIFYGFTLQGSFNDALFYLNKAISLPPTNSTFVFFEIARTYIAMGKSYYPQAVANLKKALSAQISDHQENHLKAEAVILLKTITLQLNR